MYWFTHFVGSTEIQLKKQEENFEKKTPKFSRLKIIKKKNIFHFTKFSFLQFRVENVLFYSDVSEENYPGFKVECVLKGHYFILSLKIPSLEINSL